MWLGRHAFKSVLKQTNGDTSYRNIILKLQKRMLHASKKVDLPSVDSNCRPDELKKVAYLALEMFDLSRFDLVA